MHARRVALVALVVTALGGPSAASAAEGAAVVPLLVVNLEDEAVDQVTEALARALVDGGAGPVRGGREVRRRLPDEGLSPACPSDPTCLANLRARLEAGPLVFVVLARVGEELQADPTVVIEGEAEARPALKGQLSELTAPAWLAPKVQGWLPMQAVLPPPDPGPQAEVTSTWRRPSWPVWAAAGLSVAALGAGIGLGVAARAKEAELVEAGCEVRPCPAADVDALLTRAHWADASYGVAAVAAAAAVGLYYVLDVGGDEVTVSPAGAGVAVSGRF